jgi:hypothetical protein
MTPKEARLFEVAPRMAALLRRLADEPCDHGATPLCPREAARVLVAQLDAPFCAGTDPTWCSCPRYHNNGRKELDPTCPLHAGDARD